MCVGESFLVWDNFLLRSPWRSCVCHWLGILLPHLCIEFQGLISPWYPTLTMSTHTLYQLSYIPSPTPDYLLITSTYVCVPVRKIKFPKCIYIHFLNFSKSAFNFLVRSWGHCKVSMEVIKKHFGSRKDSLRNQNVFLLLLNVIFFYFSFVQKDRDELIHTDR